MPPRAKGTRSRKGKADRAMSTEQVSVAPAVVPQAVPPGSSAASPRRSQRKLKAPVITASASKMVPASADKPDGAPNGGTGRKRGLSEATHAATMMPNKRPEPIPATQEGVEPGLTSVKPPKHARKAPQALLDEDFNASGDERLDEAAMLLQNSASGNVNEETEVLSGPETLDSEDEETRDTLAEQSESEDELLTGMCDDDVLAVHLAAEVPRWAPNPASKAQSSTPPQSDKGKGRAQCSADEGIASDQAHLVATAKEPRPSAGPREARGVTSIGHATVSRPVFRTPGSHKPLSSTPAIAASVESPESAHSDSDAPEHDISLMPAAAYQIVYPPQGGVLALKAQHLDIQDVISATRRRLERNIVTLDAFPDARDRGRSVRMAMVETVKTLQPPERYAGLVMRMVTDGDFTRALSTIPNQRISSFRGKVKEKSDIAVAAAYGLVSGNAKERIEWLLPELIYIYPTDFEKKSIVENKPYQHPIIASVLRETFFKGPQAFASKNEDIFTSSLPQRPEKEIPMVMLALVGTAIHASLLDWSSGDSAGVSSFSADRYVDAYKEHIIFMKGIKSSSAIKYHVMMYKLYNTVSGNTAVMDASPSGTTALTRLNIDAMDED
ncbi:hypothetical protein BN946_scf184766.g43 [Trametes cinnabarina]|uniref:DUF6532 domain-containing protein n=1 Tax=Pycnoporus cinnabarinus TaxID=5643 RepID=A0A060SBS0_PYCCI|nr:hypothetical protein BN946_scf184766.g43 [Trametes cinnabarina]